MGGRENRMSEDVFAGVDNASGWDAELGTELDIK